MYHKSFFIVVLLSTVVAFGGCASSSLSSGIPSQFEVDVRTAPQGLIDQEARDRSELLHSYLAGRFSYIQDDFDRALKYFEKANSLIQTPYPNFHATLAELYLKKRKLEQAKRAAETALQETLALKSVKEVPLEEELSYRLLLAGISEALQEDQNAEVQYQEIVATGEKQQEMYSEAYILYASLLGRMQRNEEATVLLEDFFERGERYGGDNFLTSIPVAYELLGRFYEMEERYAAAEEAYTKAVGDREIPETLFPSLLRVYLKQNKSTEARKLCKDYLASSPDDTLARRVLAELAISDGSVDEGIALLRKAQTREEQDGEGTELPNEELRFRIAMLELERQNYKAAARELLLIVTRQDREEQETRSKRYGEARYYLASIYAGSDRKEEAIGLLDSIPSNDEVFVKAKTFAAYLLREDKQLDRAAENLQEVLEMQSSNKKARSYLALILHEARRYEEEKQLLEEGLSLAPENERFLFQYGVTLDAMGAAEQALQAMERVLVVNPENTDALNFVAYAFAEEKRDLERAEILIRKALEIRPQDGYYLDTLGWILFQQEQYGEAEAVLERAVLFADSDPVILEHYGDALRKNEKRALAEKTYRRALQREDEAVGKETKEALGRIRTKLLQLEELVP
ncbi:tetratricopeptide repeat protein [bacterium]|nr:tetratricopeptide repeat protein [bacterium]